jgi:hypothetical protein
MICGGVPMNTVEEITAAIAKLSPKEVAEVRAWLVEREAAAWDAQIEQDERAGRLNALAERALAEHQAGRTRPSEPPHHG